MKRTQNILLMVGVIALALLPLWIVDKPAASPNGEVVSLFGGSDDKAKTLISEIRPDYQQCCSPCRRRSAPVSSATTSASA